MNSNANSFTLLLSQFGRQEFTDRFFSYLENTACPYPVVFCDGNADGRGRAVQQKYAKSLDIDLVEFKQTVKFKHYFSMIVQGLRQVKTPYVMICDNDDFIVRSGIEKHIEFLNNNKDYICAGSPMLAFQIDHSSTKAYGKFSCLAYTYDLFRQHEPLDSVSNQIQDTFRKFQANFYNVYRTDILIKIWEEIGQLDFSDLTIMEYYIQLRAPSLGKVFTDGSSLHYIRQSGTGTFEHEGYDFSQNLVNSNMPEDVRLLAFTIASIYEEVFSVPHQKVSNDILRSYSTFLIESLPYIVLRYRFPRLFRLKTFFASMASSYLFSFLKIRFLLKEKAIFRTLKKLLEEEGYQNAIEEIDRVKKFVLTNHKR